MKRSEDLTYFEGEKINRCCIIKYDIGDKQLQIHICKICGEYPLFRMCACQSSSLKYSVTYKRRPFMTAKYKINKDRIRNHKKLYKKTLCMIKQIDINYKPKHTINELNYIIDEHELYGEHQDIFI